MEIPGQKTHPLAIAGMVMAFIPLLNCLEFPVSIVALVRTNNNTLKYKGMGLCIAAIIVSLITSAVMIPVVPLVVLPRLADAKRNTWAMQSVDIIPDRVFPRVLANTVNAQGLRTLEHCHFGSNH